MTEDEIIDSYLDCLLRPKLARWGVANAFANELISVVRRQMLSAVQCRRDDVFWNTLSLIVSEEAPFYRPETSVDIKTFVVLTLRNSPFETLQSDCYASTGLEQPLARERIIEITSDAIRYFTIHNPFDAAADGGEQENYYRRLSEDYPVAWNALRMLANASERTCKFAPLTRSDAEEFSATVMNLPSLNDGKDLSVKDGFSDEIEPQLAHYLQSLAKDPSYFFCDCFKMLSRNPKLLLHVLEFLLLNGCAFVTVNYYISNGYAERRKNILKAAHTGKEIKQHLCNVNGISPEFRRVLLFMHQQMR